MDWVCEASKKLGNGIPPKKAFELEKPRGRKERTFGESEVQFENALRVHQKRKAGLLFSEAVDKVAEERYLESENPDPR